MQILFLLLLSGVIGLGIYYIGITDWPDDDSGFAY